VNKAQLVARIAKDTGITKADVARVIDALTDHVTRALRRGENVKLVDFGSFLVTRRRARQGHNPHSGEPMRIAARRWPRFAAGKALRRAVREGSPARERRRRLVPDTDATTRAEAAPPGKEPPATSTPEKAEE
jgi:DNA-binding protein HU-beta